MSFKKIVEPFREHASRLSDGESVSLPPNTIKDKTHQVFTARLDELSDNATIIVGHGYNQKNAGWVEIKRDTVAAYNFFSFKNPNTVEVLAPTSHGLDIRDYITVSLNKDAVLGEKLTIFTSSSSVELCVDGITGYDGSPLALARGCELRDCSLSWSSDAYASPVWIYGDSYLNHRDPERWPFYLYRDGFTDVLLSSFPGEGATRALEDFKLSLTRATPEFALWLLGMNNGDGESDFPNNDWLAATQEFISLCEERGITPILATIPTTPKINNNQKNAWVKASGHRYVDFNSAVGADLNPAWYPGMLSSDLVHPEAAGARALYCGILTDFPEIMRRR